MEVEEEDILVVISIVGVLGLCWWVKLWLFSNCTEGSSRQGFKVCLKYFSTLCSDSSNEEPSIISGCAVSVERGNVTNLIQDLCIQNTTHSDDRRAPLIYCVRPQCPSPRRKLMMKLRSWRAGPHDAGSRRPILPCVRCNWRANDRCFRSTKICLRPNRHWNCLLPRYSNRCNRRFGAPVHPSRAGCVDKLPFEPEKYKIKL